MKRHLRMLSIFLVAMAALVLAAAATEARAKKTRISFEIANIFFEFNSSAEQGVGDLGVHVFLDGEDWKELEIVNPEGRTIFEVEGKGPYREFGMTELFFEGAEPSLADVLLEDLLAQFPKGKYKFTGRTVEGKRIEAKATLTHAIPAGPGNVSAEVGPGNKVVISWDRVTGPPNGFPNEPINVVAYQIIVGSFQVTLPATSAPRQSVTVPREFVRSLEPGVHDFEVLAIEAGGNQTITESSFIKP